MPAARPDLDLSTRASEPMPAGCALPAASGSGLPGAGGECSSIPVGRVIGYRSEARRNYRIGCVIRKNPERSGAIPWWHVSFSWPVILDCAFRRTRRRVRLGEPWRWRGAMCPALGIQAEPEAVVAEPYPEVSPCLLAGRCNNALRRGSTGGHHIHRRYGLETLVLHGPHQSVEGLSGVSWG